MDKFYEVTSFSNTDELTELVLKWEDFNERKYDFQSGTFDKDEFTSLIKDTIFAIRNFRMKAFDLDAEYIMPQIWNFNRLLVEITIYCNPLDCDEKDDEIFAASQAIARLLRSYASCPVKVFPTDESGLLFGDCDECGVSCAYIYDRNPEYWSQTFEYDPISGDMSEFIELIRRSEDELPF